MRRVPIRSNFGLPKNSRLSPEKTWPAPASARRIKEFQIYRFNPDSAAHATIGDIRTVLQSIQTNLLPPDAVLVGPTQLRVASERFAANAKGEMIWFHVCLSMFKPQSLFDNLLRPAIENPQVTSIHFILDESQKPLWEAEVLPKIGLCKGKDKVQSPRWVSIQESVSVIIADARSIGGTEILLSFWGEPFMARTTERNVPRYIFHVQEHSELVTRLVELVRTYRFMA